MYEILIELRRSLCQPSLHDPTLCHNSVSMANQVVVRLHNDRGQVPYQRYDTLVHFNAFLTFAKPSIKTLIRFVTRLGLGLKEEGDN